ncbi:hypothetical protein D3C76_1108390 [compost metagenome]
MVLAAAVVDAFDEQPEFLPQLGDVAEFAGEKLPARPDLEALRIGLEHLGGVAQGIDADGVEKDVLADPVAEQLLHLAQTRGFQWAGVAARGKDEIDHHHLALDQVIEKMHLPTVLVGQQGVGEIIATPRGRGICDGSGCRRHRVGHQQLAGQQARHQYQHQMHAQCLRTCARQLHVDTLPSHCLTVTFGPRPSPVRKVGSAAELT